MATRQTVAVPVCRVPLTAVSASMDAIYPSLQDRGVLISGGASGIGAAIVERFVAQGSRVAFLDRNIAAGEALRDALAPKARALLHFLPCDLTDLDRLRDAAAEAMAALGETAVLVNNAGQDDRHSFADVTGDFWDSMMATNLRHQFFLAQAVAPAMRARGAGSIINIGSIAPAARTANAPVYVTAKAAVAGMTRALARDLGVDGIRVNCVIPGLTMTPKWRAAIEARPDGVAEQLRQQCLKALLVPDDIARLVLWLAADDSRMATAHDYHMDAGRT
jgi:D-xylose 1-dehydrogenase